MHKKNFLLFLTMFIANFSLNAQSDDFLSSNTERTKDFKFYQIENYSQLFDVNTPFIDLKINLNSNKKPFFQKYNHISTLNDVYDTNNGTFSYVKSSFSLENMNRGVKIDSYNPLGMSPNGKSLIFGVFGVVLDKLQQ